MIVGISGTNGSGKETVAEILRRNGFEIFSLSDAIRDEAASKGLPTDREVLINLGNEIRSKFGRSVLADRILSKINAAKVDAVVVSIRNPGEVDALKKDDDFLLVWVDADPHVRYERSLSRRRDKGDMVSFDEFLALEAREKDAGPDGQRLDLIRAMADVEIINEGSFEDLEDDVIESLGLSDDDCVTD